VPPTGPSSAAPSIGLAIDLTKNFVLPIILTNTNITIF
jgi:hypothetical protein